MSNNKTIPVDSNTTWGDVAIDGLWPGLIGGIIMIVYLLLVGLMIDTKPLAIFAYFSPNDTLPAIAGLGTHLAVSAVHGTIFGLITAVIGQRRPNKLPLWLAGILFGLLLWLTAHLIIVPSGLSDLGAIPAGHFLLAHILFGAVMGRMLANSRPDSQPRET
jgi:hypothetical protein